MTRIVVAGTGTGVGKTVVSAILATALKADYWKPIECGKSDTRKVQKWIETHTHRPAYRFKAALSPHAAAELEHVTIVPESIKIPYSDRSLIIETVGGVFTPITQSLVSLDLFKQWDAEWVIVSRHYLGSINHTLLTIEALKRERVSILGIVFNGKPNLASESAILKISGVRFFARVLPEFFIRKKTIQKYAEQFS
jgi:dethiobiotin synthetase